VSRDVLTPFSYTVLVLVGRRGAGAHDLVGMARQGRIYWNAAESQWYAEPKRLARLGLLAATREPGKTRERTRYELTDAGVEALRRWMEERAAFPRMQLEPVVRLLAADLVGDEAVLESLRGLRDDLADLHARLDLAEAAAEALPHRRAYLLLNHRLARAIVRAHEAWLDDVERELG
jgi:PadR family transcriptional regulator, regulatory protein AphA